MEEDAIINILSKGTKKPHHETLDEEKIISILQGAPSVHEAEAAQKWLKHKAKLTAESAAKGIVGMADIPQALGYLGSLGAKKLGMIEEVPELLQPEKFPSHLLEAAIEKHTPYKFEQPENRNERMLAAGISGLSGLGVGSIAGGAAKSAPYIGKAVSTLLGEAKTLKEASKLGTLGGTTGLTAQVLQEAGLNPLLAGLVAPIGVTTAGRAISRHPLAKMTSKLVSPKEDILHKAATYDIELPLNVASDSKILSSTANNYLKSMFTSKAYKDSLQSADQSLIEAVKKRIDVLGELEVHPSSGSEIYREALRQSEKGHKKTADILYKRARENLTEADRLVPINTLNALKSEPMQELLGSLSPSTAQAEVINRIKSIQQKLVNTLPKEVFKAYEGHPQLLEKLGQKLPQKEVPLKELIGLRSSLLNTLEHDPNVRGVETFLSRLTHTLDKDIKSTANKDFLKDYQIANDYYKRNIGETFRESIGNALVRKEKPIEAFNLLNTVPNINFLERITTSNPKSKELFNALKKGKFQSLLEPAIQGSLENGHLRTGNFANLFQKGKQRNELMERLIGTKQYNELADIATIAREFSDSGRELLNTSGTAHVVSDMNLAHNIPKEVYKTLGVMLGAGGAGYTVAGLPGAVAALASPYVISRLMANKDFVKQVRAYAIARKQGKDRYADTIMKKIVPLMVHQMPPEIVRPEKDVYTEP